MNVRHAAAADACYVRFDDLPVARTQQLDACRLLDYSAAGTVHGVEFLDVSAGVHVLDLGPPVEMTALTAALVAVGINVLDQPTVSGEVWFCQPVLWTPAGGLALRAVQP